MEFLSDLLDSSRVSPAPWAEPAPGADKYEHVRSCTANARLFPQTLLSGLSLQLRSPSQQFQVHTTMARSGILTSSLSQRMYAASGDSEVFALLALHSQHRLSLCAELALPRVGTFTLSALECGQKAVGTPPNAKVGFKGVYAVAAIKSHVEVAVDVANGPTVEGGIVLGTPELCVGVGGKYNTGIESTDGRSTGQKLEGWSFIGQYKAKDGSWRSTASLREHGSVLRWNLKQQVNSALAMATEIEYQKRRNAVVMHSQGEFALSARESLFGTLDSEAKVGLAYRCRLSPLVQVAVSGRVNTLQLETDSHQVGVSIQLG
ncbi:hypothetical protein SPRG_08742 [Saprolegnia parasitica CBS 223.65]|uniref:Mitochondrial import receptor subunit TOM40 n=1 Tax=Saprolegnia parasitica (strain CBS 223.65) TaxID=695850 RepID=A0A067C4V6_SAPPC|nr:hypothetical protein SPRG_08742 [Saprolegnia parasitica CBS 223.65]KDO25799.1 hypothetical protein SPRG_08742 [Saprolegnia parasitica CBS 223.65]|eukprot:XP_012203364.1 hypothetical protein SPRG_08742 [Saprolegnia parasitica CBS 223.65]